MKHVLTIEELRKAAEIALGRDLYHGDIECGYGTGSYTIKVKTPIRRWVIIHDDGYMDVEDEDHKSRSFDRNALKEYIDSLPKTDPDDAVLPPHRIWRK